MSSPLLWLNISFFRFLPQAIVSNSWLSTLPTYFFLPFPLQLFLSSQLFHHRRCSCWHPICQVGSAFRWLGDWLFRLLLWFPLRTVSFRHEWQQSSFWRRSISLSLVVYINALDFVLRCVWQVGEPTEGQALIVLWFVVLVFRVCFGVVVFGFGVAWLMTSEAKEQN